MGVPGIIESPELAGSVAILKLVWLPSRQWALWTNRGGKRTNRPGLAMIVLDFNS
jgi:hypothetical protein